MPEQPRSARDTLAEEARRRVNRPECPFCGTSDWVLADETVLFPYVGDLMIGGEGGGSFPVLPFACMGCGFVRGHAEQILRKSPEPDDARQ
jgi:hypothetical protein